MNRRFFFLLIVSGCLANFSVFGKELPNRLSNEKNALEEGFFLLCTPIGTGTVDSNENSFKFFFGRKNKIVAYPVKPESFSGNTLLPYLQNSKEFEDSVKLRRKARYFKFEHFSKILKNHEKFPISLNETENLLAFLSKQIKNPVVILDQSVGPKGKEAGNCLYPKGIEVLNRETGKPQLLENNVISINKYIKEGIKNDFLDISAAHENGHGIMHDLYGKSWGKFFRPSTNGHNAPIISDAGLAFTEGWAEAFEAVYGANNPKLDVRERGKYGIPDFRFDRQDPIRRESYIWAKPYGGKTGTVKSGLQLMSTEGVIAALFYDILTSRAIVSPFEKCVKTFLNHNPLDFPSFIRGFLNDFPEDKKVVFRIVLENTKYMTMSNDAGRLYKLAYQSKLDYVRKKGKMEDYSKSKRDYEILKESLFKEAVSGGDIFSNVGPQMWFSGEVKEVASDQLKSALSQKPSKNIGVPKFKNWVFNLDLNTVSEKILTAIGLDEQSAMKVISEREARIFFKGDPLEELKSILGDRKFSGFVNKANLKKFTYPSEEKNPATENILYSESFEP